MYGRRRSDGRLVPLTDEQRREHPGPPELLLMEQDNRKKRNNKLCQHHPWRAIVVISLADGTIIAVGKGHGRSEQDAYDRARSRCLESYHRGEPPIVPLWTYAGDRPAYLFTGQPGKRRELPYPRTL